MLGAERPDIQVEIDDYPGIDGREWHHDVACSELIEHLSPKERAVLMLHLIDQKTFAEVGEALQVTRPAAHRLFCRALRRVQGSSVRVRQRTVFLKPHSLNLEREGDLPRLVRALHAGVRPSGYLRGRRWMAARTGLPKSRIDHLMDLLHQAGCLRDRGPRQVGRLVHASPEETLAALGIRPNEESGSKRAE